MSGERGEHTATAQDSLLCENGSLGRCLHGFTCSVQQPGLPCCLCGADLQFLRQVSAWSYLHGRFLVSVVTPGCWLIDLPGCVLLCFEFSSPGSLLVSLHPYQEASGINGFVYVTGDAGSQ